MVSSAVDCARDNLHSFFTVAINNYEDGAGWRSDDQISELLEPCQWREFCTVLGNLGAAHYAIDGAGSPLAK